MEKIIAKIAGLGVPGIVLLVAIGATGYTGAAAITTALAALGPGGMIGGIALLGVIGVVSSAITEYGFDAILTGVVKELYKRGETKHTILCKISKYPISKTLKAKLKIELEKL
ncbi:MAG: hypothetical protein E7412_03915 [Ruminococcaceae bacterium]|nr:hypothetical protein [Oscillospiraceae bacterium]